MEPQDNRHKSRLFQIKTKPGFILIFPISQESESYKNCFLLKIFFNSSELSPKIEISVISYVKKKYVIITKHMATKLYVYKNLETLGLAKMQK